MNSTPPVCPQHPKTRDGPPEGWLALQVLPLCRCGACDIPTAFARGQHDFNLAMAIHTVMPRGKGAGTPCLHLNFEYAFTKKNLDHPQLWLCTRCRTYRIVETQSSNPTASRPQQQDRHSAQDYTPAGTLVSSQRHWDTVIGYNIS